MCISLTQIKYWSLWQSGLKFVLIDHSTSHGLGLNPAQDRSWCSHTESWWFYGRIYKHNHFSGSYRSNNVHAPIKDFQLYWGSQFMDDGEIHQGFTVQVNNLIREEERLFILPKYCIQPITTWYKSPVSNIPSQFSYYTAHTNHVIIIFTTILYHTISQVNYLN